MQEQTVSVAEAARILGISRQRAYRLVHSGALYGVQVFGRWRVPRADVERRLRERRAANPVQG